jgi:hypothetical protein
VTAATATLEAPADHGAHPLDFAGDVWTCPITGQKVPKGLEANLRARKHLADLAAHSIEIQTALWHLGRQSFLFWVNLFVDTYHQIEVDDEGNVKPSQYAHVPFISWPVQDHAATELIASIENGGDVVVDKSRDMGATWLILLVFLWYWLFHADSAFKVLSRKEQLVDNKADPDSLFWKLDYALGRLPEWMIPNYIRTDSQLANQDNGSVIDGESTNADAGRGGRRKAILKDEAAAMRNLGEIMLATDNSTSCRILTSTPIGPGKYSEIRFSGRVKVIILGFWDHPQKGRGRRLYTDPFDNKVKWTSPFRDRELELKSRREVATNQDIDHSAAGSMFFDSDVLGRQRARAERRPPLYTGDLLCRRPWGALADHAIRKRRLDAFRWNDNARGRWRLWCELEDGRPDQTRTYSLGADISHGMGASESTISVTDTETRLKVAEFADSNISPDQHARMMAIAGLWFGGPRGCGFAIWEANGAGGRFGEQLVKTLQYPWYYRHTPGGKVSRKPTEQLGWFSSDQGEAKRLLLEEYRGDMAADRFINLSVRAIAQAEGYVFYANGSIGPGRLEAETAGTKKTHGDLVIADALSNHGVIWAPRMHPPKAIIPHGSLAAEIDDAEREEEEERDQERW